MKKLSPLLMLLLLLTVAHQASACYGTQISGPSTVYINANSPFTIGGFSISVDPTLSQVRGPYLYTRWHTSYNGTVYTGDAVSIYFFRNLAPFTHNETVFANSYFTDGSIWENNTQVQVVVFNPPLMPSAAAGAGPEQSAITILDDRGKVLRAAHGLPADSPVITEGLTPGLYIMETRDKGSVSRKKIFITH
ncbi:hypothetical protein KK083_06825 [Fulvivirgaceae bacterium PWU4]|uniref:T9SS type A sorting domain-containing protein n=1 Tax=Chryseosolibacter histidini TaxID=2782349 RepID=A0AAP2GM55_9BACT|nr:hypothetical protein [Chryseosolibacter histidini]MBT1696578.1 hypothetical protein [Chryseosolibacter histidini]